MIGARKDKAGWALQAANQMVNQRAASSDGGLTMLVANRPLGRYSRRNVSRLRMMILAVQYYCFFRNTWSWST